MSRDHYEVLGVRQSATDASIRRAIQTATDQISADASLSPAARKSRLAEIQAAADELSTPASRDRYDAALRLVADPASAGGAAALLRAPSTWMIAFAVVIVVAALYWQYDRAQTRQRVERERVAAEQQQEKRAKEIEERRVKEQQRLEDELRAQKEAEDKSRQEVNEIRSAESQKKQYIADDRIISQQTPSSYETSRRNYDDQRQITAEAYQKSMEERRQRYEDEAALRNAKAEVERQKRYLEQQEREDQYARARREAASRPSRY